MKYLVENGCDIHQLDGEQNSLLHVAVRNNDIETVRFLVSNGIQMNTAVCFIFTIPKEFFIDL